MALTPSSSLLSYLFCFVRPLPFDGLCFLIVNRSFPPDVSGAARIGVRKRWRFSVHVLACTSCAEFI